MTSGTKTIMFPVKDLAQAKALYDGLFGVDPDMDEPYYVGYTVDGQDVGLDPNGHAKGLTGVAVYWHVDDIEKSVERLRAAGGTVLQAITDVGGGKRIASVTDNDGNIVGVL